MRRFQSVDIEGFRDFVERFQWRRRITEVHLHHTWRPTQQQYRGLATIEGMWRHHTETNGWSDIAQHVSIGPDGAIWLGRNFNWSPASAVGFNGNSVAGPFMIEMIGDFDIGRESPTEAQMTATLAVIQAVQRRFDLPPSALRFHNEMSSKSCPGNSQSKAEWIAAIEQLEPPTRDASPRVASPQEASRSAIEPGARSVGDALATMDPAAVQPDDLTSAEHMPQPSADASARGPFGRAVDSSVLEALSDHVINLSFGRFSDSGLLRTDETDVDRIVGERLEAAIAAAASEGQKARVLVYAHGGLVSEKNALLGAYEQLSFWRENHVYPLFFIWETGIAETLKAMILAARSLQEAPRGAVREWLDEQVQEAARALGADRLWSAMKRNAELANDTGGGAAYVGSRLSRLIKDRAADIELHMAGHSAGSIFLTRFLKNLDRGVSVKSAHFLAPAVTNELFLEQFAPRLGKGVEHLTVYTMTKALELDDTVTPLYNKSLLYMVHGALEPKRDTDILGLEISLRGDPRVARLFGLGQQQAAPAEVVWSPSDGEGSGSASQSRTHGGFDNDKATLESVCRRVLGRINGEPIAPYRASSRAASRDLWGGPFEWPPQLAPWLGSGGLGQVPGLGGLGQVPGLGSGAQGPASGGLAQTPGPGGPVQLPGSGGLAQGSGGLAQQPGSGGPAQGSSGLAQIPAAGGLATSPGLGSTSPTASPGSAPSSVTKPATSSSPKGARRALCIGIDNYRFITGLNGCLNDAASWRRAFEQLGFEVETLPEKEATGEGILARMREFIRAARAGDRLVIQYAGHGTHFDDVSNDEADRQDSALCAIDCGNPEGVGGLVVDDDIYEVFKLLPKSVHLTAFFDCCHSGTMVRTLGAPPLPSLPPGTKARYMAPTQPMIEAYRRHQQERARSETRAITTEVGVVGVQFSACLDNEVAFETNGAGAFTSVATKLLARARGQTNRDFHDAIIKAFGPSPRQTPKLYCDPSLRDAPLALF